MEDLMEGRRMLVSAVMEAEAKSVAERVPDKGIFKSVFWDMAYYGTGHTGRLYTQYSENHGCAIRAAMIPEGSDRQISNYVFFGSKDQCVQWLKDPAHLEELIEIYDHLAQEADEC